MGRKRKAEQAVEPPKIIPCHTVGCQRPAQIRTARYSLGGVLWPLCHQCDDRLHSEKSEAWCKANGLFTTEQKRAYCLKMAGSLKLPIGVVAPHKT